MHSGCSIYFRDPRPSHAAWGGESEEWRVVVDMGEWVVLDMRFTDFLWAALRQELFVPLVEGEPSFERVGGVGPH